MFSAPEHYQPLLTSVGIGNLQYIPRQHNFSKDMDWASGAPLFAISEALELHPLSSV